MPEQRPLLDEGHQRLIRAKHGYVLCNRNDAVIGRLVQAYGEYFEGEVDIFRSVLRPGDVALDIGANIGVHTLALARLVGRSGFVLAFEPQRLVFQTLCANVALNSLDNVHCVNAAVSDSIGTLNLFDANPDVPNNFGGVELAILAGTTGAPRVSQLTLDDYLEVASLRLMKIDVEGMESAVVRGARRALARFKPVLYVENDRVDASPELLALLMELGYQAYWHFPAYVGAENYFGNPDRLYPLGLVDRGGRYLEPIGLAVNLLCLPAPANGPPPGLRAVAGPQEHPCRRECAGAFPGISVLRER